MSAPTATLPPVAGRDPIRAALARARSRGQLPSTLLLYGMPGVGKQRLALWIGQLVLCEAPAADGPCGSCTSCRLALRLDHPDLHWYFPLPRPKGVAADRLASALEDVRADALAERRLEPLRPTLPAEEPTGLYLAAMRELRRVATRKPAMALSKIIVIGDAEALVPQGSSPEAANSILKLLEEPPEATTFVLTSSEPGSLLPTIRSRAAQIYLPPIPEEEVRSFLERVAGASAEDAATAARRAGGSIGVALAQLSESGEGAESERSAGEQEKIAHTIVDLAAEGRTAGAWTLALSSFGPTGGRSLSSLFDAVERELRDRVEGGTITPVDAWAALGALRRARGWAAGNGNPQLVISSLVRDLARHLHEGGRSHPARLLQPASGGP